MLKTLINAIPAMNNTMPNAVSIRPMIKALVAMERRRRSRPIGQREAALYLNRITPPKNCWRDFPTNWGEMREVGRHAMSLR